jgi:hypothetical protein
MLPFVNNLMPFRYQHLEQTLKGYQMTGVPLVEYNGTSFQPAGVSDDTGIYYFIPKIASFFQIDLSLAISLFFSFFLAISIITSLYASFKLFPGKKQKIVSAYFLTIIYLFCFLRGDIYIFTALAAFTVIPLFLRFIENIKFNSKSILKLFLFGIAISIFNFVRSNSATGVIIFIIAVTLIYVKIDFLKRIYLIVFLILGILFVNILINATLIKNRNDFLNANNVEFSKFPEGHIFWHQVYIGFGFLTNPYDIQYDDNSAEKKAKQIRPDVVVQSLEYENILKHEVTKLIFGDPWFLLKTVFSKIGVVFLYILIFSNIGIIFIFSNRNKTIFNIAFVILLLFNLIFPLLAVPYPSYILGTVAAINVFALFSFNNILKVEPDYSLIKRTKLMFKKIRQINE